MRWLCGWQHWQCNLVFMSNVPIIPIDFKLVIWLSMRNVLYILPTLNLRCSLFKVQRIFNCMRIYLFKYHMNLCWFYYCTVICTWNHVYFWWIYIIKLWSQMRGLRWNKRYWRNLLRFWGSCICLFFIFMLPQITYNASPRIKESSSLLASCPSFVSLFKFPFFFISTNRV